MKKIVAILLALSLCFMLASCGKKDPEPDEKGAPLKLAVLTALTGNNKETGDRTRRAVEMAVEEINAAGGCLGQDIQVEFFDIGSDQQSFLNALQLAVNTEGVSCTIGYANSSLTVAGADIIEESEIPNITMGNSSGIIKLQKEYVWQCRLPDTQSTAILARIHHEDYHVNNPAVLYMTESAGQSQLESYVKSMEQMGISIPDNMIFGFDRQNTSDFTPYFTQIMASGCDGLAIFCTNGQDGALIAETAKNVGFDKPVATSSGNMAYSFTQVISEGAANGWFGVGEFNLDAPTAGVAEYVEKISKRGAAELGKPAWNETAHYDAVHYIAMIADLVGSADPKAINEGMKQLKDYQGIMSSYSYHDDHTLANYGWLAYIDNNKVVFGDQVNR